MLVFLNNDFLYSCINDKDFDFLLFVEIVEKLLNLKYLEVVDDIGEDRYYYNVVIIYFFFIYFFEKVVFR